MELTLQRLLMLGLVGLAAQLVDGGLGMGYGVTSSTLLLAAGLAPASVSASVHLSEIATSLGSGVSHWRYGNVDWPTVRRIAVPGCIGGFVGAGLLSSVSGDAVKPWIAGVLLVLGVYVLARFVWSSIPAPQSTLTPSRRFLVPLGLFAGFIDAVGGGGWGPVATPSLLVSGRMQPRQVIGSVSASEFAVTLSISVGFLTFLGAEGVQVGVLLALLAGGLLAAPLAARVVRRAAPRPLGAAVGGLIVLTNSRVLLAAAPDPVRFTVFALILALWGLAVAYTVRQTRAAGVGAEAPEPAVEGVPVAG